MIPTESPPAPAPSAAGSGEQQHWFRAALRWLARRLWRLCVPAAPVVGLVVVWWSLTATDALQPDRIYPSPGEVWTELVRITSGDSPLGSTYTHAGATFVRLGTAFAIAFVAGTLLGVLAGRVKFAFDFLNNLVWIGMAVPSIVWVFIFVIAVGITNAVPIAALVVLLAPPILIAVAEGTKSIPGDIIAMADSFKVGRRQRLLDLYIPSVVPYMASSARVSFALGIKIVIIAEVIGLPDGIGLLLKFWFDALYLAPIVAWGIILILVGVLADQLVFSRLERWAKRSGGSAQHTTHVLDRE